MARTTKRPSQSPRRRYRNEAEREARRKAEAADGGWYAHLKKERERREAEQSERDSSTGGNVRNVGR